MKIKKITLYKYSIPLHKPLKMKGSFQNFRDGLIIEISNEERFIGFGDAAPFPGLHRESLKNIIHEIKNRILQLSAFEYDLKQNIFSILKQLPPFSPSLQFAIEWAFVDLIAKTNKVNPAILFNPNPEKKLLINALLTGSFEEVISQAIKIKDKKYKTVKLKVATRPLKEDIELVRQLNDLFEGKVQIRLDANQAWTLEQAVEFGQAVKNTNIEYIEEPLTEIKDLLSFYNSTGIFYALDETLYLDNFKQITNKTGLRALIIKPPLFGNLNLIKNWVHTAKQFGAQVVFSSAFESGIGLRAASFLASAWSSKSIAHGLDTFKWLKEDVTAPAFATKGPELNVHHQQFDLKYDVLEKIYEFNF